MVGSVLLAGCTGTAERVDTGSEPASSEKSSRSKADESDGDGLATAEVPVAVIGVGLATAAPARSVDVARSAVDPLVDPTLEESLARWRRGTSPGGSA